MVHRPPSYVRYQREHPPITVHLTREMRSLLDNIKEKTGMSYAGIIRDILNRNLTDVERADDLLNISYENGFNEGYDLAESEWKIWYNCSFCEKPIEVKPESKSHHAIIRYMRENRWGHTKCPRHN